MSARLRFRLALAALTLLGIVAPVCPARAQQIQPPTVDPEGPPGPFRDVFNRPQRRENGESLTFTLSGYGGYDDNVITDQLGVGTDPRAQAGGSSVVGGDAGLQYVKTVARRMNFAANAAGSYRYFPDRSSLSTSSVNGGVGISAQVGKRTRLLLDQSVVYSPYYQLGGLFPTLGEPELAQGINSNLDFAVFKRQSIILASNASIEQQLTRRSTLIFTGQFFNQTLDDTPPSETNPQGVPQDDVRGYTAGIHYKRQLTRYLSLRLGDEYRRFVYPTPTRRVLEGNNIDLGVDYARSLAFSRRTRLSLTTGSSIVSFDGRQYGDITGNVSLSHLFTRKWQGQVSYNRNLNFVETLNQPLFADSANAQLQGIIGRRLLMTIGGGYVSGRLGLGRNPDENGRLRTGTGNFSLAYAFTMYLRATFEYSYFKYDFSNQAQLPDGLQPTFDRNSVRGGLSLVLPVIR